MHFSFPTDRSTWWKFGCFPAWNILFVYWPWIFGIFHVENITFLSEMRVRRSHHQLHVESLWTTWTLWKLAQDTWLKLFPAAMTTGFLVKCELSTFPLLIPWYCRRKHMKYHQISSTGWNGRHAFFFRLFFSSCLKLEHSRQKHTPQSLIGKALMRPFLGSHFAVGMDPLIVCMGHWDKKPTNGMEIVHRRSLHFSQIQPVFFWGWKFCRFGFRFGKYATCPGQTQQIASVFF